MADAIDPGEYAFDRAHSQIGFRVEHLGLTPIRGLFAGYTGRLVVGAEPDRSSLEVTVDLTSVQSGNADRDERLQTADYFDSARQPTMTFRSNRFIGGPSAWTVEGELTLKTITRPLALQALVTGRQVFAADGKEHIGVTASGQLSRIDFDVGAKVPAAILSDVILLDLAVQLLAT